MDPPGGNWIFFFMNDIFIDITSINIEIKHQYYINISWTKRQDPEVGSSTRFPNCLYDIEKYVRWIALLWNGEKEIDSLI